MIEVHQCDIEKSSASSKEQEIRQLQEPHVQTGGTATPRVGHSPRALELSENPLEEHSKSSQSGYDAPTPSRRHSSLLKSDLRVDPPASEKVPEPNSPPPAEHAAIAKRNLSRALVG